MTIKPLLELFSGQITETTVGSVEIDVAMMGDFVAELVATEDSGSATLDAKIQDSADGVTWYDWIAFQQLAASGNEVVTPSRPCLGLVRAVNTVTGSGTWTSRVRLSGSPNQ